MQEPTDLEILIALLEEWLAGQHGDINERTIQALNKARAGIEPASEALQATA